MLNLARRRFSRYSVIREGEGFAFRAFLKEAEKVRSPWHDLELFDKETDKFTAFFEIARGTTAKMEVATDE